MYAVSCTFTVHVFSLRDSCGATIRVNFSQTTHKHLFNLSYFAIRGYDFGINYFYYKTIPFRLFFFKPRQKVRKDKTEFCEIGVNPGDED